MNVMSTGVGPVPQIELLTSTSSVISLEDVGSSVQGLQLWQLVIQVASLALICVLALAGNFLVFFSLLKKDQLLIPSNRLVFSLTASNFGLAALVFPFTVVSIIQREWAFGIFWCNFTAFITVLVTSASVLTIGVITIDRYYAIVKPLLYTFKITRNRSTILLLTVWLLAFTCALPPLFGWSKFQYHKIESTCMTDWSEDAIYTSFVLSTTILLPLFAMIICYYLIFQVVRTKCRKIHVGKMGSIDISLDVQLPTFKPHSLPRQSSSWKFALPRRPSWFLAAYASPVKGLRTICVVIGVFLVSSAPYLITAIAKACSAGHMLPAWFHVMSLWLWLSSSATHPLVYGFLNRSIRKELRSSVCPHSKQRSYLKSKRLSTSISLLDFSSVKYNRSGKWSSVASEDGEGCGNYSRKGSQDSGTVMTESDFEAETSFLTSTNRKRRVSAPPRLHLISTHVSKNQDQLLEPFPVLQALASEASVHESQIIRHLCDSNKPQISTDINTVLDENKDRNITKALIEAQKNTKTPPIGRKGKTIITCSIDEGIMEDF